MKVCFVLEYYYPHIGGFEVLFQHLAEGIVEAGHQCTVVTCRLPGTKQRETVNGVDLHRVSVPALGDRYWFTLAGIHQAWQQAKRADIVITTTYNGTFPAWLASRLTRKPAVIVLLEVIGKNWHSIGLNPALALGYRVFEDAVLRLPFERYISISNSTRNALAKRGIARDRISLAYPGIDHKLFNPAGRSGRRADRRSELGFDPDAFVYLYFGRPGYMKGIDFLVKAAPLIKQRIPQARLLLLLSRKPDQGYRRVIDLINASGLVLGQDVIVLDPVPRAELPDTLQASDCVVVPSLSEGFGFTCVEACTMDIPVVASAAGSLPEVIFGRHVLVEPGNAQAIADGVERVFRKDTTITDKKTFLWQDMIDAHLATYAEAVFNK